MGQLGHTSSSVQVLFFHLFGANPLSEPNVVWFTDVLYASTGLNGLLYNDTLHKKLLLSDDHFAKIISTVIVNTCKDPPHDSLRSVDYLRPLVRHVS